MKAPMAFEPFRVCLSHAKWFTGDSIHGSIVARAKKKGISKDALCRVRKTTDQRMPTNIFQRCSFCFLAWNKA